MISVAAVFERISPSPDIGDTPTSARRGLHILISHLVEVVVDPETAAPVRFIAREQTDPMQAFDRIYAGAIGRLLDRMASLLRVVSRNSLDEYAAKLRAVTILGEKLVLRNARATLLAGADWTGIGEVESHELKVHTADVITHAPCG